VTANDEGLVAVVVWESDWDHPPNDHTNIREGGGDSKEAEEVQGMARNELNSPTVHLEPHPKIDPIWGHLLS